MRRTLTNLDLTDIPEIFHPRLRGQVYDSSCSGDARVYYLPEEDGGCFLKSAPGGSLQSEARMDEYFHSLGLGPEVLRYISGERDWLLTRALPGEDCCSYLDQPERLSETLGQVLRQLHSQKAEGCPQNRLDAYLADAHRNYRAGKYDAQLFPEGWGFASREEAWQVVAAGEHLLRADTLIHGDYCLPNVMLNNWKFSGFLDLGRAGMGDRHMDIFWGAWTLNHNLKTGAYCRRFLDAYGREGFEEELLRLIAAVEVFG